MLALVAEPAVFDVFALAFVAFPTQVRSGIWTSRLQNAAFGLFQGEYAAISHIRRVSHCVPAKRLSAPETVPWHILPRLHTLTHGLRCIANWRIFGNHTLASASTQ